MQAKVDEQDALIASLKEKIRLYEQQQQQQQRQQQQQQQQPQAGTPTGRVSRLEMGLGGERSGAGPGLGPGAQPPSVCCWPKGFADASDSRGWVR